MKHFIAFFVAIALSFAALANAGEVTSPVIDGMTLRLGNYVQRVQVRAKSFGPGFFKSNWKRRAVYLASRIADVVDLVFKPHGCSKK